MKKKSIRRKGVFAFLMTFALTLGIGMSLAPKQVVKTSANEHTVTVSVAAYATANGWGNGVKYPTIVSGAFTLDGTGGANSTKYYTASPGTWRFYSSDSPKGKIVITGDETVEEITSVTSNPSKTWTISGKTASHEVSANTNFSSFTIKYLPKATNFGTLDRITVDYSGAKTKYTVMEEFSANGLEVTAWDGENNNKVVHSATTDFDGVTFEEQHKGSHTVTVSYTEGVTKTATYPITVTDARLFTEAKASELNVGATYTIVDPSTGMAIGAKSGTIYSNIAAITVDGPPKAVVDNDDILEFELEAGSTLGSYAFKILNTEDAGKYISYTGSSNALYSADTITDASSWVVTDTNVTNVGTNTRIIKYNPSSPRFAAYTGGQNDVKLYVDLDTVVAEPEYETTTKIEVSPGAVKDTWYVHETFAADGLVVVAHDENNGVHKILGEGDYSVNLEGTTFTSAHLGQQDVVVSYDGQSDSFSVNVLEPRAFTKVTDMSQVQVGGEYVIVGENDGDFYALSTSEANNRRSVGIAKIDDDVFQNLNVQILKLHEGAETVAGSYAFESLGGDKDGMYLAATSTTSNYLQSRADIDEKSSWMISLTDGVFSVVAEEAGTTRNEMRFNNNDLLFSAYGTGQSPVALYVDLATITVATNEDRVAAEAFADYMRGIAWIDEGVVDEALVKAKHAEVNEAYDLLSVAAQNILAEDVSLEDAYTAFVAFNLEYDAIVAREAALAQAKVDAAAAFDVFIEDDYSVANWALVVAAKEDALLAINSAETLAEVANAKEAGLLAIADIKTLADEAAEALADAKDAAVNAINDAFNALSEDDYSPDNWADVIAARDSALSSVNAAETVEAVNSAKTSGLDAMAAVKKLTEEPGDGDGDGTSSEVPPTSEEPDTSDEPGPSEPPVETPSEETPEESKGGCFGSAEATLLMSVFLLSLLGFVIYKRKKLKVE